MDWNERQRIGKAINENLKSQGGKPPIRMGSKKHLDADLEGFFDWVDRDDPKIWDDFEPHVKEWYRQIKGTQGRGFVRHFRDFTPTLAKLKKERKLTFNALMVYLVYRDSANNSDKKNRLGLGPGETCIGGKTMAEKSGVRVDGISEANKLLAEAGLVVFMRRLWELSCS